MLRVHFFHFRDRRQRQPAAAVQEVRSDQQGRKQSGWKTSTSKVISSLRPRMRSTKMHASNAFIKGEAMAMLTVRNLPDDVHRALKVRAAQHGRSTEAEVREILESAVKPETRVRLGEALAALGRKIGLTNEDFEAFNRVRDKTPAEPLRFE